ncbi:hypothetical protein [Mycoavidus sp. B2-EB]|uniref:hypothetical protein n=1 Tax=Mycoavidus sp. B2-EB TaxID=2651972 RepID=UPI001626E686|nr:hypothetical protein [Mycoavidus sp. B2-EB]BBO59023.1 hypothetical protein MPB2EB_0124 [Mycoavidus sp. B2-EB]
MNTRESSLLRTVISKRNPEKMKLVDALLSGSLNEEEERDILIDIVSEEMLSVEIAGPDWSFNATGNELESLIDAINRKAWGD